MELHKWSNLTIDNLQKVKNEEKKQLQYTQN